MNIRQLNEIFNLYQDGKYKYADIDAKSVYDNCINKDFGSHTFEEANKFKEFVGITKDTNEEELRGIRNTLVRYWADECKKYNGDDWGRSRSKEESDRNWKMGDQMQFFTTVIDMAIDNLPEEKRMHEDLKITSEADPEWGLGDFYFATTEQDMYDSLDKMTLGDSVGCYLKHKEYDETCELTIDLIDENLYVMKLEEDNEENNDDSEGKNVMDTDPSSKEDVMETLKSLFTDYRVMSNEERKELVLSNSVNEDRLFPTKFDTLPKKEPVHKVGDKVNINGINGEIIKVKPMKMSDTSTYQIKLDNGKTVWRYEEEINESLNEDDKFDYMMLSRLEQDCKYFLGYGNGCEKHLWAGNVEDQIAEMRKIYDKLPEKPQWLSLEDIDKYEKEMLAKRDAKLQEDLDNTATLVKKLADESLKEDKEEDLIRLQNEYDKEAENLPNGSKEMYALNKKYGKLRKKVNKHYSKCKNESLNEDIKTEYAIIKFLKKYGFATQEDLYNNIGAQPFVIDNTVKELLKQNKIKFDDTHGKINGWKLNESLKDYKEVGKILQNKKDGGFNIAEENEPMLTEDQPTLKSLLNNLAKYL